MSDSQISLDSMKFRVKFRIQYSKSHLFWLQFFRTRISITPKLIYIFDDRVCVFCDPSQFTQAKRRWHTYISQPHHHLNYHFRILVYSENLVDLIKSWYQNVKNLQVIISQGFKNIKIELYPPHNLRQFIIGKHGNEIEMLSAFLDHCIYGNWNYHLILH